jgi:hypothetical protein
VILLVLGGFMLPHWRPSIQRKLSDGNRPSANHEPNEYYERSLLFGGGAQANRQQMRRMLERALAFDPKFAAPRAEYAFSHVVMLSRVPPTTQACSIRQRRRSAKR